MLILYDILRISECEIQKFPALKVDNQAVGVSRYLRTDRVLKEGDYTSEGDDSDQESEEEDYMEEEDDNINYLTSVVCPLLHQAQKSYLRSPDSQSNTIIRKPQDDVLTTLLTSSIILLALAIVIRML